MELQVGFCRETILELYKKIWTLRADLTKVPDKNHKISVHFLSNCTLAGLLLHPPPSHHDLHLREKYIAVPGLHIYNGQSCSTSSTSGAQ
jgi:hypothetical protein